MDSAGDCYDNALAESFFATLECELITRSRWRTRSEPPSAYLRRGNVCFSCEGDEKLLPTVLEQLGEDQMMASADMPHMEARENSLQDISERSDLRAAQKRKILGENARCFYGL